MFLLPKKRHDSLQNGYWVSHVKLLHRHGSSQINQAAKNAQFWPSFYPKKVYESTLSPSSHVSPHPWNRLRPYKRMEFTKKWAFHGVPSKTVLSGTRCKDCTQAVIIFGESRTARDSYSAYRGFIWAENGFQRAATLKLCQIWGATKFQLFLITADRVRHTDLRVNQQSEEHCARNHL